MPTKINDKKCSGCGECLEVCPVSPCVYTASIVKNKKKITITNTLSCIECGACINACPEDAIRMDR